MKALKDSVTLGVGAIGIAMFSLGFSLTGVACNTRPDSAPTAEKPAPAQGATATTATATNATTVTPVTVANGAPTAPAPETNTPPSEAPHKTSASSAALRVKRLVVTERIEGREPVISERLSAGSGPIYAFAELENTSAEARKIRITFEHEDGQTVVGHAELEIPGNRPRFRTWGNTRNIQKAGNWRAVVRGEDGQELARTEFTVEGS